MIEQEFQTKLAALIKRTPYKDAKMSRYALLWENDWEDFMVGLSETQTTRALELYELHVSNENTLRQTNPELF